MGGTGTVTGELVQAGGSKVSTTGQATGRSLSLIFDLAERGLIFGVGVGQQEITACAGLIGGPLVGPRSGDSGDWAVSRQSTLPDTEAAVPAPRPGTASPTGVQPNTMPRTGIGPTGDTRPAASTLGSAIIVLLLGLGGLAVRAGLTHRRATAHHLIAPEPEVADSTHGGPGAACSC